MRTFGIIVATLLVLLALVAAWYYYKKPASGADGSGGDPTDCDPANPGFQKDGTANAACGTPGNGGAPDAAPPGGRSILISANDLEYAPNPNGGISVDTTLFRKATLAPVYIDPLIHYVSSTLPGAPHIHWWYKNGHYTFINTVAGTHYYKKSILPNEISLPVKMADPCYADWYLSGSKYTFDRQGTSVSEFKRCIYKKQ